MHGPTGIDKFEAALIDKSTHLVLEFSGLLLPPHREELDLNVSEPVVRVSEKGLDGGI